MADEARSRLGRGLASLIGDVGGEAAHVDRLSRAQRRVPIEFLKAKLSESIKQHGVIQPIVVRPVKGAQDRFEIIAGERRWRASQRAGLHDVPIVTVDVGDSAALEIAIIENVQRSDLNAMEEALGYHALAAEYKHSQEEIAKLVGKSRSHVANMMRLTKLPEPVQIYIAEGKLSAGHARALIGVTDASATAKKIVEQGLSVRETEALAHEKGVPERGPQKARGKSGAAPAGKKDADTVALERRISDVLGLKVSVDHRDPGGRVEVKYRDLDQLDEILRRLEKGH
ncbi:MAG: ParB/RepB/Spo0J family partition protein [Hyphomonadaceae bacterium]|nr:ParB/RepB/Spo0J family partition protein [Hyphomonadaceae bacterium]